MFVSFKCEACGSKLEADSTSCGTVVDCPQCTAAVTVPHTGPGPGVTVGGFKILSLLGKGGMGEVFLARQLSMDRDVALKILPRAMTLGKEDVQRFLNEVRMAARLEHPNIVAAYEAGEDAGVYYLAMALVRGETIESRLKTAGVMAEAEALHIARQVAVALAYAWDKHRLIHRDVKPGNIVIDDTGEPKLMDMGLSKSLLNAGDLTMAGTVMGTPNYMSPEQADGSGSIDFRSDIYSLGATLYNMVTGRIPFAGKTLMETLRKQAVGSLPDPREDNPALSASFVLLLEKMLARQAEHRHRAWDAVIGEMDAVLDGCVLPRRGLAAGQSVMQLAGKARGDAGGLPKRRVGGTPATARSQTPPGAAPRPATPEQGSRTKFAAVLTVTVVSAAIVVAAGLWLQSRRSPARNHAVTSGLASVSEPVLQPLPRDNGGVPRERPKIVVPAAQPAATKPRPDIAPPPAPPKPEPPPSSTAVPPPARPIAPEVDAKPAIDVSAQLEVAVDCLLRRDTAAAGAILEGIADQPLSPEQTEIRDGVRKIVRTKETVLESLNADTGKEIEIGLKTGVERVQIISVNGENILARRQFKREVGISSWIENSFSYADLVPAERMKRLGLATDAERAVAMGLCAVEMGKSGSAAQFFVQAPTPLGRLMVARCEALRKPAPAPDAPRVGP